MKTLFSLILLFVSLAVYSQNLQDYTGIYKTNRECIVKYPDEREDEIIAGDYWPISTEYLEITILANQEQLGLRFMKTVDVLSLNMINDTEFTFSQLMTYPFNNPYLIEGSGSFENNQLKLDYTFTGGDIGICEVDFCIKVECSSEGIKTNDTKNPQQFLGEYLLEGTCNVLAPWQEELPYETPIAITIGTESDLLINSIGFASSDFKAFVVNDSLFIPSQVGNIVWQQPETFQGKGKIQNDSLFISFTNGGEFGFLECECKGKRTGSSATKETAKTTVNIYTTKNTLTIESPEEQITNISLYDISGKKILEKQNLQTNQLQYQIKNTSIALCTITLQSGKQIIRKIIIK
ncbi:MAG: hypothetical protein LBR81_04120 [Prevotellaceae bacterium]|jgi:hypothetical protein|nr:hypothetical protein [Prevotellaceae bacterium]